MAEWSTCPSRDDLQRLILRQLVGADAARIKQHLNGSLTCLNVLRECAASDELLEAVRARRVEGSQPTATMAPPSDKMSFEVAFRRGSAPGIVHFLIKTCFTRPRRLSVTCFLQRNLWMKLAVSPISACSACCVSAEWVRCSRRKIVGSSVVWL
jgi:hypothetical protein